MTADVRWKQRFDNFDRAFVLLREVCERGVASLSQLEREGAVQRFEFAFELAWKTIKDYLEENGVVLDIVTPRNVMIDPEGMVRLIDFGIAAPVTLAGAPRAAAEEPLFGSPGHMPPEQLRRAVAIAGKRCHLEASGGITLANVRAIAETGIDSISLGGLTHSARSLDLGLDIA